MKVLVTHGQAPQDVAAHALFMAVHEGRDQSLRAILEACKPPFTQLVLRTAALRHNGRLLPLLLEHGADVNTRNDGKNDYDSLGETALHDAAAEGDVRAVRMLLDAGADVNAQDARGRTPLMQLAAKIDEQESGRRFIEERVAAGRMERPADVPDGLGTLRLLLERGADARRTDHFGNDALTYQQWTLFYNSRKGEERGPNEEAVTLLRQAGATDSGATIDLFKATRAGDVPAMRAAIQAGADVNRVAPKHGVTPLIWCGTLEMVNVLLEAGADPNKPGLRHLPLISAASGGNLDVVKRLIEAGADIHALEPQPPNSEYIANAYSAAQLNDKPEVVAYLRSLGAGKPRRPDWKPLAAGVHSWNDFSEMLVRGDVKAVADGLAGLIKGTVELGVYGKQMKPGKRAYVVVRPKGMAWCNVWQVKPAPKRFENQTAIEKRCKEIAAACKAPVIEVDYSDTSDAAQVVRVDAGRGRVEVDDGWDRDALEEVATHLGDDAPAWMAKRLKEMGDDELSSTERVELLAAQERFVAAAFGFYAQGGLVDVDVDGYPAEAFDEAAFVTT
jgi:ankyrin repeat protein